MEPFCRGTAVVTGPKTERRGTTRPLALAANRHSTTPTGLTAAQPLHRLASPSWPLQHMFTSFVDAGADPEIHGYLHSPAAGGEAAVVLTHGAGANCQSKLLVGMAEALAAIGFIVLRFDLPFRRARSYGPPFPATASRDRDGLRCAATIMRKQTKGRVVLGGHSYGGRQASMLAADEPQVADGLLLLASSTQTGATSHRTFSEADHAGIFCSWNTRSLRQQPRDGGCVKADSWSARDDGNRWRWS
jgi:pimeloyl-ACP methyl ester carboxylesterase